VCITTLREHPVLKAREKPRTPSDANEFQIGLCGVVEADLELFGNSWGAGFLGERLYCPEMEVFRKLNTCELQYRVR